MLEDRVCIKHMHKKAYIYRLRMSNTSLFTVGLSVVKNRQVSGWTLGVFTVAGPLQERIPY